MEGEASWGTKKNNHLATSAISKERKKGGRVQKKTKLKKPALKKRGNKIKRKEPRETAPSETKLGKKNR